MSNAIYQFLNHIDAPKRILTLTMDELVVVITSLVLLILSNQKIVVSLLSVGLFTVLRYLKKGEGPKGLLILAYWYLPSGFTQFFLPQLPSSHHRVYVA